VRGGAEGIRGVAEPVLGEAVYLSQACPFGNGEAEEDPPPPEERIEHAPSGGRRRKLVASRLQAPVDPAQTGEQTEPPGMGDHPVHLQ